MRCSSKVETKKPRNQEREKMNENSIMKKHLKLNVPITSVTPWDEMHDACIRLGGKYDGIEVNIGEGYYSVSVEVTDGEFFFVDGEGDIEKELKASMNAK